MSTFASGGLGWSRPPFVARALLRALLPGDALEFVRGDLDEEFRCRAAQPSRLSIIRAGIWYRSQVFRTALDFWRDQRGSVSVGGPHDFRNKPHLRSPGDPFMLEAWQDIRYSARNLGRSPGFTAAVLLTLALGVGATTAMFSAVNEVLLRPFGFAEPDRLVAVWDDNEERGWSRVEASPANALDWRDRVDAFEDVALASAWNNNAALEVGGQAIPVEVGVASGNIFSVLGTPPAHGRTFTFDETWDSAGPLVVLSHDMWARHFAADPRLVGQSITLDGTPFEVIGVMGPDFDYEILDVDMWTTYRWSENLRQSTWFRQAHVSRAIARLKPDVTVHQARAELHAVGAQLREDYPRLNAGMEPDLGDFQAFLVGDRRGPLLFLFGAVGLLQLIACANVANLLLVRAASRRTEFAVRAALGAPKARLARLLFTEAGLLALAGTAVGVAVAALVLRWIEAIRPPELPQLVFRLDPRMLGFVLAVVVGTTLLSSVLPVARTARARLGRRLSEGTRTGSATVSSLRTAGAIVALEVALAVVLVLGAGLMIRTLSELGRIDAGIDTSNVLTFQVTPPSGLYPEDSDREAFAYRVVDALESLPGVRDAAATRSLPFDGYGWSSDFSIQGWGPEDRGTEVRHRAVTSGYFKTMGVPLVAGAIFDDLRVETEAVPVVVNQAFADLYFPDESPVGRQVAFDAEPGENTYWYPIVGVVGNERMVHTTDPEPEIISHFAGDTPGTLRFTIKTEVPPSTLVGAARDVVADLDARIPFMAPRTMEEVAAEALIRERFLMTLLAVFAGAALLLAAVGVYGVAAQGARARVREIGIRMALGATGDQIRWGLLRRAGIFVGVGLAVGLAASAIGSQAIAGFLFGVEPLDPITWLSVATLLAVVGLLASYLPARAAARSNPAQVLQD